MSRLRLPLLAAALLLVGAVACDDDQGPGTIRVEISGPIPLGAVAVELVGGSPEGVRPLADGWVEGQALTSGGAGAYRIVAIQTTPGPVLLEVEVADLDDPLPQVTILEAVDAQDRLVVLTGSLEVTVRR